MERHTLSVLHQMMVVWVVSNNAAGNVHIQVSVGTCLLISLG